MELTSSSQSQEGTVGDVNENDERVCQGRSIFTFKDATRTRNIKIAAKSKNSNDRLRSQERNSRKNCFLISSPLLRHEIDHVLHGILLNFSKLFVNEN